jgi:hypothetical protein
MKLELCSEIVVSGAVFWGDGRGLRFKEKVAIVLGGLKLQLLQGDGLLAKAQHDTEESIKSLGFISAESFNGVTIEAGQGVVKLGDTDVKDRLMKVPLLGPAKQCMNSSGRHSKRSKQNYKRKGLLNIFPPAIQNKTMSRATSNAA